MWPCQPGCGAASLAMEDRGLSVIAVDMAKHGSTGMANTDRAQRIAGADPPVTARCLAAVGKC